MSVYVSLFNYVVTIHREENRSFGSCKLPKERGTQQPNWLKQYTINRTVFKRDFLFYFFVTILELKIKRRKNVIYSNFEFTIKLCKPIIYHRFTLVLPFKKYYVIY